jgi:hypothetical protein
MEIIFDSGKAVVCFIISYFFAKFVVTILAIAVNAPLFLIRVIRKGVIESNRSFLELEADIDNVANVSGAFFGSWTLVREDFIHWSIGILIFILVASFVLLKKEGKLRREKAREMNSVLLDY